MKLTKTQLKEIIKEELMLVENERKQMRDFQNYIEKKYKGKSLNGFTFSVDTITPPTRLFTWVSAKGNTIYATPFWGDKNIVALNVVFVDGDELGSKILKLQPSDDMEALEAEYLKILKPYFSKIK